MEQTQLKKNYSSTSSIENINNSSPKQHEKHKSAQSSRVKTQSQVSSQNSKVNKSKTSNLDSPKETNTSIQPVKKVSKSKTKTKVTHKNDSSSIQPISSSKTHNSSPSELHNIPGIEITLENVITNDPIYKNSIINQNQRDINTKENQDLNGTSHKKKHSTQKNSSKSLEKFSVTSYHKESKNIYDIENIFDSTEKKLDNLSKNFTDLTISDSTKGTTLNGTHKTNNTKSSKSKSSKHSTKINESISLFDSNSLNISKLLENIPLNERFTSFTTAPPIGRKIANKVFQNQDDQVVYSSSKTNLKSTDEKLIKRSQTDWIPRNIETLERIWNNFNTVNNPDRTLTAEKAHLKESIRNLIHRHIDNNRIAASCVHQEGKRFFIDYLHELQQQKEEYDTWELRKKMNLAMPNNRFVTLPLKYAN